MIHRLDSKIMTPIRRKLFQLINTIWKPKFLDRLDSYFLVNWPWLWVSKSYYVVYRATLMMVVCILIACIYPAKIYEVNNVPYAIIIVIVIESLIMSDWVKEVGKLDLEKQFGNSPTWRGWLELLTYMFCIAVLYLPSTLSIPIVRSKIAATVDMTELNQYETQYEELKKLSTTCIQAIKERSDLQLDEQFISKFTGYSVSSDNDAQIYYCNALTNVHALYNFIPGNSGWSSLYNTAYVFVIIAFGWAIFGTRFVWETSVVNYFVISFGYSLLSVAPFFVVDSIFPAFGWTKSYNTIFLALSLLLWSLITIAKVILIDRQQAYSGLAAYSLATFPLAVVFTLTGLRMLFTNSYNVPIIFLVIGSVAGLLLIPYWKGQSLKLLSLPEK